MIIVTNTTIWMRKGDTGNIIVEGLPKEADSVAYLSIVNPDTGKIVKEFSTDVDITGETGVADFGFAAEDTDDVPVGNYVYGVKDCYGESEDTLVPEIEIDENGNVNELPAPEFIIAEKYAEGTTDAD